MRAGDQKLGRPPASARAPGYAELQVMTNFTFLEGGSHAEELVAAAKALGLSAIAVTDRNSLSGAARMHLAAEEAGLQLIVGARLDLEAEGHSLLCFPTNRAAYGRLSQLLTLGKRRAEKGSCQLSLADVAAHAEGQIVIAVPPTAWDWREAVEAAGFAETAVTRALEFPAPPQNCHPRAWPEDPSGNEDCSFFWG